MARITVVTLTLFIAAVAYAGPVPKEFEEVAPEIRKTCLAESGVDESLVIKAGTGEFVQDDKLKCYLKCVFDQFRLVTKDAINYEAMLKLSPPDMKANAIKMIEMCRETTGKDICDLSLNVHQCFYNAFPREYFIM